MRSLAALILVVTATIHAGCGGSSATASHAAVAPTAAPTAAPAAKPPIDRSSPAAFTASVRARILAADAARSAEVGTEPLQLVVIAPNGHRLGVSLDRVWSTCSRLADSCDATVDELIAAIGNSPDESPPVRANLLALVRHREYGQHARTESPDAWIEPLVGELAIVYAFDDGDRFRIATTTDLARLGLDRDEAAALARANVEARVGRVDELVGTEPAGLFSNATTLEPSLLLQRELWGKVAARGRGRLVATVPATDALVYMWATGEDDIAKLRAASEQIVATAERPLSAMVLVWTVDHWEVLR